jgi:hypothetical protein
MFSHDSQTVAPAGSSEATLRIRMEENYYNDISF